EWFNPGGSVKDRPALSMIEDGERRGALTKDRVIIDSTSGNTGIAYALVGAAKGYRVKLVMPGNVSAERKALVAAFGAEIVYSDGLLGGHSSGAALWAVRKLAATVKEGVVVTVFPDSGDRYLSTGLYGSPHPTLPPGWGGTHPALPRERGRGW